MNKNKNSGIQSTRAFFSKEKLQRLTKKLQRLTKDPVFFRNYKADEITSTPALIKANIGRSGLDQRVPQGPGWFGQVRSILETIKIQPRSKIDTPTKQGRCKCNSKK